MTDTPNRYGGPAKGHPPQSDLLSDRAVFTEAYAVIPKGVLRDITHSRLPYWEGTRAWVLARPLSGFAETFAHLIVELSPGGGSDRPEPDPRGEAVIFVTEGAMTITLDGRNHLLDTGGYAYLPPGREWRVSAPAGATFHWIRKAYEPVEGFAPPEPVFTSDDEVAPAEMPGTEGRWCTQRFIHPDDLSHDMQVNIVSFQPGASIPFMETHVMEHGLYVLEGKAVYRLNRDWVEVEAGDYMWLRAFCPQACYAGGPGPFRYLLYKDINRHVPLTLR